MENRPLIELVAGGAYPELAAIIRARMARVLERWEALVRETMPRADRLTRPQLRDDAPQVLEHVAKALESDQASYTSDFLKATAAHGATRFAQDFDLGELLADYSLLRATLLDEVASHLGRLLEAPELIALNAAVDLMSRRAVQAFADYQSQELKAATEAQSKYLSFLSHDLRGGLNGVFLMIEVLKRELAGEPRLSDTVRDLDAMRRLLLETVGTMDRFLHAERFRKGKVELKPSSIHLRHLLNETVSHFTYQAKEKGLNIRVEVPEDCTVTSDRELLSLIIQNLLSNAVKYTEKGEVVVIANPTSDHGCLISVRDQGPGIAPERMDELFGPFTRGETHGKPGVGLGLSIARQAAELLGAELWAVSTLGEGSTFHVRVPHKLPMKV